MLTASTGPTTTSGTVRVSVWSRRGRARRWWCWRRRAPGGLWHEESEDEEGPLLRWDDWWIAGESLHRRRGRSKREVTEQEDEEEEEDEDNVARDAVSKVRVARAVRRRGSGGVSGRNGAGFWPRGRTTLDVVALD